MTMLSSENLALAGIHSYVPGNTGNGGAGGGGGVWNASASYNSLRTQGYAAFLSDEQKCRLERIRQARMLFAGKHRQYFLDEARTLFDFPFVKINGIASRMYITYNVLGLISLKSADLLFGSDPLLDCDDSEQWQALQDLVRRTQLHAVLLDAAIDASPEGEAHLEAIIHTDGQVYIQAIPNEEIFGMGEVQPDGQYASYLRYKVRNAGTNDSPIWLLLETVIGAGAIDRACWQLDKDGRKTKQLAMAAWDPHTGPDHQETGLSVNTVVWVPNLRGMALSDYDCAIELQDALNAKNTQISRVLAKHSDPKVAFPRAMADPQGNVPAYADAFFFDGKDELPSYITWNAELSTAVLDRGFALNQLLVRTETSPVLLGLKEGAAPDAYKKVRLEAFNSITKAARKAITWTAATQRILDVALALDNTRPGVSYATDPVGVTLRDGIPIDQEEQATTIATLRAAGAMSRRRAVRIQLGDEEATDAEIAELEREAAAATPSVLFNEPSDKAPAPDACGCDCAACQAVDCKACTCGGCTACKDGGCAGCQEEQTDEAPPRENHGMTPAGEASAVTGQELQTSQDTVLNGSQIASATAIVSAVVDGTIPRDAGLGQLQVLFNLSESQTLLIMGSAGTKPPVKAATGATK